jgi:hypothetical protein
MDRNRGGSVHVNDATKPSNTRRFVISKLRESERLFETNVQAARQNSHNYDRPNQICSQINATDIDAEN